MNEPISSRLIGALQGFLALIVAMFVTGGALSAIYRPERTHVESNFRPAIEGGIWKFVAAFHYWGSACLIVFGGGLLVWLFLAGFKTKAKPLWLPVLAATGLSVLLQVLGNALPMDRHDVQTVNIEASIAARTPIVGPMISRFMLGGDQFSEATISHWYRLTFVGVIALAIVTVWLALKLKRDGRAKLDVADTVFGAALVAIPVILAAILPRATGELYGPADMASQSASPSWYVLPMHALLHLFDRISISIGWIGSALIPGLAAVGAATAPMWAKNWSSGARRNLLLGSGAALVLLMAFSSSRPAPIAGNQPVHDVVAGSGGIVDVELAQDGLAAFNKRCFGCHGMGGKGGAGGPSLLQVQKKTTDPQWYMDFIRNPSSKKPGTAMPAFPDVPAAELKALAEWLRSEK